jgi:ParB family chromosome partitioning protein
MKRKALGKGLDSLIPKRPAGSSVTATPERPETDGGVLEIDLDRIRPNRSQPRERFDPAALEELARSMKSAGVIQPVLVRRDADGSFELIAGERRWRAAQRAGLLKIPAVVRDVPDDRLLEVALIENVQREELNPIEEAHAYRSLLDTTGWSQSEIAERVGKNRVTVSNALRLLTLAPAVQSRVRDGAISAGHARALAGMSIHADQIRLAQRIEREQMSVREVERAVARAAKEPSRASGRARSRRDPNVDAAEQKLQQSLGTKVRIVQSAKGSGRLELYFYSGEELQRLYDVLDAAARADA